MSGYLLADTLAQFEDVLTASGLDLKVMDRIGPIISHTPNSLLSRGVLVRCDSTTNLNEYRDDALARVRDTITVEGCYLIVAGKQKKCRAEAMLLEEQIRVLLTTQAPQLASHTTYVGTTQRGIHPLDASWWFYSMTFTTSRDAALGGA